jgi:DNA-binding transcriptional ArsR family regulator
LIIESLLHGTMNISQLAKKIGSDRATVAYHLGILEQAELVDSEYQMLKPPASMGKIGRFYRVKPSRLKQASEAFEKLSKEILKQSSP